MLRRAEQARSGVSLADSDHPSLKKMSQFCAGMVSVYAHPSPYRSLKLACPLDVGGVSCNDWVSSELAIGLLEQAVGILTRISGLWWTLTKKVVHMALNLASLNAQELSDPSFARRVPSEFKNFCVDVATVQVIHFFVRRMSGYWRTTRSSS